MNNFTLKEAIKQLKEHEELIIKYDDGKYTFTLHKGDKSHVCYRNDIHITNKGIWLDCNKICFMSIKTVGDD